MVFGNQNMQNFQSQQNLNGVQQPYFNTQQVANNRLYDNQNINHSYNNPSYTPYNNYSQGNYGNILNSNNNQIWVQGEAGAKAYPVQSGTVVMLMDSESDVFYIKSTDSNGVPLPLRTFDYKERVVVQNNSTDNKTSINIDDYITREEFEKKIAELNNMLSSGGNNNEPTVQPSKQRSNASNNKQYVKHNTAVQ